MYSSPTFKCHHPQAWAITYFLNVDSQLVSSYIGDFVSLLLHTVLPPFLRILMFPCLYLAIV